MLREVNLLTHLKVTQHIAGKRISQQTVLNSGPTAFTLGPDFLFPLKKFGTLWSRMFLLQLSNH